MLRGTESGQAAVEGIGISILVALLVAALSLWVVREVRPPPRPPALVEAVAQPLRRPPGALEHMYPLTPAFTVPRGRDDEPIGRVLRALGRGTRDGVVLGIEARNTFNAAFAERLRERGMDFLRDPLGDPGLPDADLLTPGGALRRALENAGELWDYAEELRSLPLREAALKASEDAGRLAADATIEAAQAALRRRVARAGRPAPPPDRPGPDAGDGSRTP